MLEILTPNGTDRSKALELIYRGTIHTTRIRVMTDSMKITEALGEPFRRYFLVVLTNLCDEDDEAELARLEKELGKPLGDCIVEKEHHDQPHPWFPGSSSFDLVTLYAG